MKTCDQWLTVDVTESPVGYGHGYDDGYEQKEAEVPQTNYISWIPAPQNIKRIGKIHTWLYVKTGGLIGSRLDGMDVLLLTTIGHRSGEPRCVPLPYFTVGGRLIVVASFGGNAKNPAWIANIKQQPEVKVQRGRKRWDASARISEGAERAEIWNGLTHEFPRYANYQTLTERLIPLVVIEPSDPPAATTER